MKIFHVGEGRPKYSNDNKGTSESIADGLNWPEKAVAALQQNTPITTRVITTKMIIVVIHVLLHQFIRFRCKSYLKTGNLLLQK